MGAILAERLSSERHGIALVHRRPPGCGSTAASTAEIMWAMDVPMMHLAQKIGEDEAVRRWVRVYRAVRDFSARLDRLGIEGAKVEWPTLYLDGNILDEDGLRAEAALHARYDLPSRFAIADETATRFGIAPRPAILSDGGFEIDPVKLCHALIVRAARHGATVSYPLDVVALHPSSDGVELECACGTRIAAREVIIASGYERAGLSLPPAFSLLSTFAIATPPGTAPPSCSNAMIWEAAEPYLYIRTNQEGRIIAGGEDIDGVDEHKRNARIGEKAGVIAAKLETLLGMPIVVDRAWAATFGSSPDGLPAIGRERLLPHVWMSAGYGGNGIAFAALAADLISRELSGARDPEADAFDPYRFEEGRASNADESLRAVP